MHILHHIWQSEMAQASPVQYILAMYPRTTAYAREVLRVAHREAADSGCEYLSDGHVLAGIVLTSGYASEVLASNGAGHAEVLPGLKSAGRSVRDEAQGTAPRLKSLVERANSEVRHLGHSHLDAGHLLLAILNAPNCDSARVLTHIGIKFEELRHQVIQNMPTPLFPFGDALSKFQDGPHVHELCVRIRDQDRSMKKSLHKHDFDAARRYRDQKDQTFQLLDRLLEKLWEEQRRD